MGARLGNAPQSPPAIDCATSASIVPSPPTQAPFIAAITSVLHRSMAVTDANISRMARWSTSVVGRGRHRHCPTRRGPGGVPARAEVNTDNGEHDGAHSAEEVEECHGMGDL